LIFLDRSPDCSINLFIYAVYSAIKEEAITETETIMNPIAQELNEIIRRQSEPIYHMLSEVGKQLYFPKGILSQSAEAKEKAHTFNATIGMATEKGKTMFLPSIMAFLKGFTPEEALSYAPSFGLPSLRKAWRETMVEKNPSLKGKDISLPVVSNALTHGLSLVGDMWINPGDVILLPDKLWGNYMLVFSVRRGAQIINYPLFNDKGGFNVEGFASCLRAQAKVNKKVIALLNFPNNPTGYTISEREGDAIVDILTQIAGEGTHVLAVTDDAYFGLFYDESALKESIFARLIDRHPRLLAIKLDGATKENFVWGLRVGFVTYGACIKGDPGPTYEALEKKTAGAVRGSISNASRLGQSIMDRFMRSPNFREEMAQKNTILMERAKEVKRVLGDPRFGDAWAPYPFNSGYFMCLRLKQVKAEELRLHLLEKYGVGLISLGEWDLRIAFSCVEKEDIPRLFDLIYQGVQDLQCGKNLKH
jgi:aspartate/methionine/tyrosine aminotransferase